MDDLARGDRHFVEEEYEQAASSYSAALAAAPSSVAHEARAHALIKLGKYVEAAEDASKAIALDGGNAKAHLRKG
jgi:tetratricopeptide (TPR) repeat protein